MDKVVAADGRAVAVAHDVNDRQAGTGHLDARGIRQGTSVGRMERAGIDIAGQTAGAADSGSENGLGGVEFEIDKGTKHGVQNNSMSAAGAPHVREKARAHPFKDFFAGHLTWPPRQFY